VGGLHVMYGINSRLGQLSVVDWRVHYMGVSCFFFKTGGQRGLVFGPPCAVCPDGGTNVGITGLSCPELNLEFFIARERYLLDRFAAAGMLQVDSGTALP